MVEDYFPLDMGHAPGLQWLGDGMLCNMSGGSPQSTACIKFIYPESLKTFGDIWYWVQKYFRTVLVLADAWGYRTTFKIANYISMLPTSHQITTGWSLGLGCTYLCLRAWLRLYSIIFTRQTVLNRFKQIKSFTADRWFFLRKALMDASSGFSSPV